MKTKRILSILLAVVMCLALAGNAFASSEASGEAAASSGGALPSGGSFGDVTTGSVNNTVILIESGELTVNEEAANVYQVAEGGAVTAESITGLYLENDTISNSVTESGATAQGVTGITLVDSSGVIGGSEGYYAVDEGDDPFSIPTVTETDDGTGYSNVIILGGSDSVFSRQSSEVADGAAVAIGGNDSADTMLVLENTYLWTEGFKRTNLFADDGDALIVVRDSRIVSPGAENYKLGWQTLYGGARCTLLQAGDSWFYNSEIVTEGWGGLAIDSSPNLDLYAVNTTVDVLGGGYISYTPGDGSINFYGVLGNSAQYGVFVTGNSTAYLHSTDDLDETAAAYMTEEDEAAESVTGDGRTYLTADYAAYLVHQGGANSTTTEAYLFAENSVLSTETELYISDNSHFLNDSYGGTSWFWSELWRGSTCVARSTNATFEFDNVELISRTGVIFQSVVNWEGADKSFSLEAGDEAVGNSLIMRNMDVTGDIRNDDIYRNLYVDITDTTITGAMISTTIDTWNAMWTVEALEQSAAYASALEEQASWADEIPNATYDAEYPYADAEIDLEMVSEYLTQADYADCNGIYLTLNEGAVWNVTGDSQLVSLTVAEGAVINAEGCEIYVNCSDYFDVTTGQQVESLEAGEYENVVILVAAGDASGELDFNDGADVSASDSPTTVLKGAALLDSTYNGEVLDVLVQDGVIIAVGEDLEGDEVIDLTGYTLMPGLIDAHVHVAGSDYNLELLATWCSQGVTSVRELGMLSTLGEDEYYDLVQEANADSTNATLVTTGKYLDVAGGYGMGPTGNMGVEITNAEEAVAEVEHKVALGYPQVKIGTNSDEKRMTAEEISAIIEAAHENGMTVSAHINYVSYLEELVALGIDESAHTPSDEMSGELIEAMVEAGVAMNTSGAEDVLDVKVANLAAFYEAGGLVTVGTDLMRNYDTAAASLIEEMRVLIEAGLTVQGVVAGTRADNAQGRGLGTGDIEVGLGADLIAVEGDVDETLDALEDVDFVMNNGVVIVGE
ncbi:MAG: amidohydrolase family protein [Oscillospiraceae bacterium]|nr:amidohydrolase family protein [Oscillospiraceae bacterium]